MNKIETGVKKTSKRRKAILALAIAALSQVLLFVVLLIIPAIIPIIVFNILAALTLLDIIAIVWLLKPGYNYGIVFLITIITATLFRRMRWSGTGILYTIGYIGLACFSIYYASIFIRKYRNSTFLRFIGFSSCIVLSIVTLGLLWKSMHWPLAGVIINIGLGLFIPFLFAFVFTLPGSDYIKWSSDDRKIFFRVIIIPMTFVFILCVFILVLPELWTSLTRTKLMPFEMFDFKLLNKPGLL